MHISIQPRPDLGDYVLLLWSPATEYLPTRIVRSKMARFPEGSPALVDIPKRDHPEHGWSYRGADALEVYESAQISMGRESIGSYLERNYEDIRAEYPDKNLRPYSELTEEEQGRHYQSYCKMQEGFAELGRRISSQ